MKILVYVISIVFLEQALAIALPNPKFFASYVETEKKAVVFRDRTLTNYANAERLIIDKLKLNLSKKERAILRGLYWLIGFADSDDNFNRIFSNFLLLLHELGFSKERAFQKQIVTSIMETSLARGAKNLSKIFSDDDQWDFISIFPIILDYPALQNPYFRRYQEQFGQKSSDSVSEDQRRKFSSALKKRNYDEISDILLDASFLHAYIFKSKRYMKLPENNFFLFLNQLNEIDFNERYPVDSTEFHDLSYLATHIPLMLTNYGEFPLHDNVHGGKAKAYLLNTFEKAYQAKDLDLFAEYVQCLKLINQKAPELKALDSILMNLQRSDGSWGERDDFHDTDPYSVFHPTWTVLTALNQ